MFVRGPRSSVRLPTPSPSYSQPSTNWLAPAPGRIPRRPRGVWLRPTTRYFMPNFLSVRLAFFAAIARAYCRGVGRTMRRQTALRLFKSCGCVVGALTKRPDTLRFIRARWRPGLKSLNPIRNRRCSRNKHHFYPTPARHLPRLVQRGASDDPTWLSHAGRSMELRTHPKRQTRTRLRPAAGHLRQPTSLPQRSASVHSRHPSQTISLNFFALSQPALPFDYPARGYSVSIFSVAQ